MGLSIAAVTDSHEPGTGEFCSYPIHRLEGTPELELAEKIRKFPETLLRKSSTDAFFALGMTEPLSGVETVVVTDARDSITYYRDQEDVHYVPKRTLEELILNK